MTLELKRFDMKSIKFKADENKGPVVVLIGRRDTGKSFLCKDILYAHRNIPAGSVISGTEAANEFYGSMVPPIFIHEEYQPAVVENLLKRQQKLINDRKEGKNVDPRSFIILDDCLYDSSWAKDKNRNKQVIFL